MSPYVSEGTLTTEQREVAVEETYGEPWNAQSMNGVEIVDGSLQLAEFTSPPAIGIEHQWNPNRLSASTGDAITSFPAEVGPVDLTGGSPTYDAALISSTAGLGYDATNDQLDASDANLYDPGTGPRTYFIVIQDSAPSHNERMFVQTQSDGQTSTPINQFRWLDDGGTMVVDCRLNGNNSDTALTASGLDDGNPHLVVLTHDGASETQLYTDNGNNPSSDTSTTVGDQPNMDYFVQGELPDSSGPLGSDVGHNGIASQFWTQTDVQDYYNYLPWT